MSNNKLQPTQLPMPTGGNGVQTAPNYTTKIINGREVKVGPDGKLIGGITGKGFPKGVSGNPSGAKAHQRAQHQFGEYLRDWLLERDWTWKVLKSGKRKKELKEMRLQTIVKRLAEQKPEILLYYAYGKPVEMHQVEAAEGTNVEFVVKVTGKEMP